MTLTKAQIVDSVQSQLELNHKQLIEIIEFLLEIIKQTIESGEDVLISSFGKFCVKD